MGTIYKDQVELQLPYVLCVWVHSIIVLHVRAQPHALPVYLEGNSLIILYSKLRYLSGGVCVMCGDNCLTCSSATSCTTCYSSSVNFAGTNSCV